MLAVVLCRWLVTTELLLLHAVVSLLRMWQRAAALTLTPSVFVLLESGCITR
jgi:hypothetical protein